MNDDNNNITKFKRSTISKATAILTESGKKFSELMILTPAVSIDQSYDISDMMYNDIEKDSIGLPYNYLARDIYSNKSKLVQWCTIMYAAMKCFKCNEQPSSMKKNNVDLMYDNCIYTYEITDHKSVSNVNRNCNITYQL